MIRGNLSQVIFEKHLGDLEHSVLRSQGGRRVVFVRNITLLLS